jgi:hypothetical protein
MIHSASLVQTENFDSDPTAPEPLEAPPRHPPFPMPAEYYSTPPGDRPPIFPTWVVAGCGIVSIVILVALFGAGYAAANGGLSTVMGWFFQQSRAELTGMYGKDVTVTQKAAFDAELAAFQKNLEAKRVGMGKLQSVLSDMRDIMSDSRVTPREIDRLTADLRAANAAAKPPVPSRPSTAPR